MEFRLIYDGRLLGASRSNTRSDHKHEIRRVFHSQLKKLWKDSPQLMEWQITDVKTRVTTPMAEALGDQFKLEGYRFVPLVMRDLSVVCTLDILFLRYDQPGQTLIQSGDIDNRLKTLFDAMRMPRVGECVGIPRPGENPFFCLLEDDSLITRVSLNTDVLLQPDRDVNDVHLIITARVQPVKITIANIGFGAG